MTQDPSLADGTDAELLADAILAAVEDDVEHADDHAADQLPPAIATAADAIRRLGVDFVRRYNRLEISPTTHHIDEPVLFVANHGFGGIFDLNVLAIWAAFDALALDRPVTLLTHQVAWSLGIGSLIEPFGARPAGPATARAAFADGNHVLVLPGGDLDAFKPFNERNRIVFGGRRGFARLAIEAGVPIVPIVTAGAGETAFVLSDGSRLTRALKLDKLLRMKALPVSVTLPWGVSLGVAGMLPYLPLPAKLSTRVLDPIRVASDESPEQFGDRVEAAMQDALTALTKGRKLFRG